MICKNCKQNIDDNAKFCPNCGTKVVLDENPRGEINLRKDSSIFNNTNDSAENTNIDDTLEINNSENDTIKSDDQTIDIDKTMYNESQMNDIDSIVYGDNQMKNNDNTMNSENQTNKVDRTSSNNNKENDMKLNSDHVSSNNHGNNINNMGSNGQKKNKSSNNVIIIGLAAGAVSVIVIILAAVLLLSQANSSLSEKDLKEKLVGQKIYVQSDDVKIPEGSIKDLKIISRKTEKKISDDILCDVTMEIDNCKIVAELDISAYYDSRKKDWDDIIIMDTKIESFEPSESIDSKLPDLLKKCTIDYKDSSINFDNREITDVSDVTVKDDNGVKDVTATITVTNNIVSGKISVNCEATYDLGTGEWKLDSNYLTGKAVEEPSLISDITDKDKAEFIKKSFGNGEDSTFISDSSSGSMIVYLSEDKVTDLTVSSFDLKDNVVTADIKGKYSNGIVKEMDFSGKVMLNASLEDSYESDKFDLKVDDVKFNLMPEDVLKKALLKYKVDDSTPVTQEIANTAKVIGENNDSKKSSIKFDCTIVINGATRNLIVYADPEYDRDTKTYTYTTSIIKIMQ